MIIKFIKNNETDLVVLGSRGSSAIKEFFLGSVSNFILHKSPINCADCQVTFTAKNTIDLRHFVLVHI